MSTPPILNLIVLRSPDIDRAVQFYQSMGLSFTKHRHGKGPEHFASESNGFVFELYPATEKMEPTLSTRIGFSVEDVDSTVDLLLKDGASVISSPKDSEWGAERF